MSTFYTPPSPMRKMPNPSTSFCNKGPTRSPPPSYSSAWQNLFSITCLLISLTSYTSRQSYWPSLPLPFCWLCAKSDTTPQLSSIHWTVLVQDSAIWSPLLTTCTLYSNSKVISFVPEHSHCWIRPRCNLSICSLPYTCRGSRVFIDVLNLLNLLWK